MQNNNFNFQNDPSSFSFFDTNGTANLLDDAVSLFPPLLDDSFSLFQFPDLFNGSTTATPAAAPQSMQPQTQFHSQSHTNSHYYPSQIAPQYHNAAAPATAVTTAPLNHSTASLHSHSHPFSHAITTHTHPTSSTIASAAVASDQLFFTPLGQCETMDSGRLPVPIGYLPNKSPLFQPLVSPRPAMVVQSSLNNGGYEHHHAHVHNPLMARAHAHAHGHPHLVIDSTGDSSASASKDDTMSNSTSTSHNGDFSPRLGNESDVKLDALASSASSSSVSSPMSSPNSSADAVMITRKFSSVYCDSYFEGCQQESVWYCPHQGCSWSHTHNTSSSKTRKGFKTVYALRRHYRKHTEYAFTCDVCAASFSRATNLVDHKRMHSGVKPYSCDYPGCGARYQQQHSLKQHKLKHQGIKKFVCPNCGKKYTANHNLKLHISKKKCITV